MEADYSAQLRRLGRYRLMFRVSLSMVGIASLVLAASIVACFWGPLPLSFPLSLAVIDLGGITAYKVLTSTAHILDRRECRDA